MNLFVIWDSGVSIIVYIFDMTKSITMKRSIWPVLAVLFSVVIFGITGCNDHQERYDDPPWLGGSSIETLEKRGNFTIFLELMDRADYTDPITKQLFTLFVPNDAAFEEYFTSAGITSVQDMSDEECRQLFTLHVLRNPRSRFYLIYEYAWSELQTPKAEYASLFHRKETPSTSIPYKETVRYLPGSEGKEYNIYTGNKNIAVFSQEFFYDYGGAEDGSDYTFMYPGSTWEEGYATGMEGLNWHNAAVIPNPEIPEELEVRTASGFIYFLDRVVPPMPSIEEYLIANQDKIDKIHGRFVKALEKDDLTEMRQIIIDCEIADPESGSRNWTEVRQFNLMFDTRLGSVNESASKIYLRPETAQGIFVNFLNVQKSGRMKIPFGIAQTGKAFRNEIVARQFIMRMREFEQMEMQFFVPPGKELEWFEFWKDKRMKWHQSLGLGTEKYRFHDHDKLAHYANAATDIEFEFPIGFKEVEGIHSRTDFDLSQHQKFSGKKMQYFDNDLNESYVPYVVETSIGLDRTFLTVLSGSYNEEKLEKEGANEERVVLKIPAFLAPVKVAVLPLVKKDGLPETARKIMDELKLDFNCQYEEKDSIGRRYRRQDAIGTPYCITIDHQTSKDDTVTIRHRDTMEQERIPVKQVRDIVQEKVSPKKQLRMLG